MMHNSAEYYFSVPEKDLETKNFISLIIDNSYKEVEDRIPHIELNYRAKQPRGNEWHTPLTSAVTQGNVAMTRLFIYHGADVNLVDGYNYTPLEHSILSYKRQNGGSSYFSIIKLLLANGANKNLDLESRIVDNEYKDIISKASLEIKIEEKAAVKKIASHLYQLNLFSGQMNVYHITAEYMAESSYAVPKRIDLNKLPDGYPRV